MVRRIEPPRGLGFVLAVPPERLATSAARAALAEQALRADAVHNVQRVALLVSSLYTGSVDDLSRHCGPAPPGRTGAPRAHVRPPVRARRPDRRARRHAVGAGPSVLVWCRAADVARCAACVAREAPAVVVHQLAPEPDGLSVVTS